MSKRRAGWTEMNEAPVRRPGWLPGYWLREAPIVAFTLVTGTLFNALMPRASVWQGRLLDALLAGSAGAVWAAAGRFLLLVIFVQTMRACKRWGVRLFANRTEASMRRMVYNTLLHSPAAPADTGDMLNRAVADVDITVEGMRKGTTELTDSGVLLAAYFITMLQYDGKLTLAACVFVPVAALLAEKLKGLVVRRSRAARAESSRMAARTLDRAEHAVLLRVNGMEHAGDAAYEETLEKLEKTTVKATVLENAMPPIYNAIALLGILPILLLGGRNVAAGRWSIGDFSAYEVIFTAVALKASKLAKLFNSLQRANVSWQRVQPLAGKYIPPVPAAPHPEGTASLAVRELGFVRPDAPGGAPVFEHLSFTAHAGQIIGVTGAVACGKSSLGLALTGLYPYTGSIRLYGRELRELPQAVRAGCIRFLWHDPMLLSDTIEANIALGEAQPVAGVLADAALTPDLAAMPQGIKTSIGTGGVRLSGGQQARVALARALYGGAPLILLDDPFSAVDMATEEQILRSLRADYPASILLLISHRLTAFPLLDDILVFHPDGSFGEGTHAQLLANDAVYAGLYRLQCGEAEGGGAR